MTGQDLVGTDVYLRHVRGEPAQAKRAADLLAAGKSAAEIEHLGLVVWLPFRVRAVYLTGLFRRVPRLILAGPDGRVFDWPLLGDYVRTVAPPPPTTDPSPVPQEPKDATRQ
jgi:hypothetical protein